MPPAHHAGSHPFLGEGTDLSIPIGVPAVVNCYGSPAAQVAPIRAGTFVGSVTEGGPVNHAQITFAPHGNGTHTEGLGHLTAAAEPLQPQRFWFAALLVSVYPERIAEGAFTGQQQIALGQIQQPLLEQPPPEALIIRTMPNSTSKRSRNYTGTHPPFFAAEVGHWLRQVGVQHLLCDLPSVDPEQDGGKLAMHRAFWGLPDGPRPQATITELIFVPDRLPDGPYWLNLQLAPFQHHAVPSRPVVYPRD